MSDPPTTPLPAAVGALPGWRVVHFLRKPPWVREEPIAAFLVDGDGLGHPMVRDKYRSFVVPLNTKDEFVIAALGEPAETFVEDARQRAREHRQWLRETREKRKTEREIQQLRWELYRRARDFEASGRVVPRGHPAEALFSAFSLLHRGTEEGASRIALAWFLVEHCTFGAGQEVARSALEQRVDAFLDAYRLPHIESGALLRHLQRVQGIETFRFKARVDGWKGLRLRPDPPREAYRPEDTDDQALTMVARVFIAHCVTQAAPWQQGSVSQSEMMAAFSLECWLPGAAAERARAQRHAGPWSCPDFVDTRLLLIAVGVFLAALVVLAILFRREPCPDCGRKGTLRWRHQLEDGKPDLSVPENPRTCSACGWDSVEQARRDAETVAADRARYAALAEHQRAMAEQERVINEAARSVKPHQCPRCLEIFTLTWAYTCLDGTPDLRYNDNPQRCTACGWSSRQSPRHQTKPTLEAIARRDARMKAEAEEAERRRVRELEAEQEAEAARRVELERQRERERPVRAAVALLKSVAKADRQLTTAERGAIGMHVGRLFPGLVPDGQVEAWLDELDATDTPASYAKEIDPGLWSGVVHAAEQLMFADGRETPAEKRKLQEIRVAFTFEVRG